jgi:UDP-glucose:(heptosyl)LPS alpha-1,3-glucosyltransferase
MKIALITERFNVALGGAERSVYEIAEQLKRRGQEVAILASVAPANTDGVLPLCGTNPDKRVSFNVYRAALENHLRTTPYDIIHSTLPIMAADVYQPMGGSYIETYLRNAASYPNKFVAAFKRSTYFLNAKRMQYLRAEQDLCQNSPAVIAALSHYVRDQYKRHFALADDRIAMAPNGVNIDMAIDAEQSQKEYRRIATALDLKKENSTLLLFGANNFRLKGLHDLLVAMAKFKQRFGSQRRLVLIVAGSGKQAPYRTRAKQLNLENDIYFTGYTNALQNFLAVCDVAVLPSYYDPCSRFILEGLAVAKPVITTRYNGASEFYQNTRHGVILDEPNNLRQFFDGLNLVSQPETRLTMSEAIRQDNLLKSVSIEAHCTALTNLYQTICERKQNK